MASGPCAQALTDDESLPSQTPTSTTATRPHVVERDFDFVERPSQDFFCPVSFELLTEPQQTSCCGHHLSPATATRLQMEGKPCPICNGKQWSAVLDKYHRRRVHEVRVRCWHKNNGCKWVGEVSQLKQHDNSCKKRPWECKYCAMKCKYGEGEGKHWPVCLKFPEPCPNRCEVGTVERCSMEQHRSVCSLEPVACEMKEFGCNVVVPRKELAIHMRESELQHLTAMTMLNLRLCRQLHQDSAKRDRKIAQLQQDMNEQKEILCKKFDQQKQIHTAIKTKMEQKTEQLKQMQSALKTKVNDMQSDLDTIMDEQEEMGVKMEQLQTDLTTKMAEQKQMQAQVKVKVDEQKALLRAKTDQLRGEVIKARDTQLKMQTDLTTKMAEQKQMQAQMKVKVDEQKALLRAKTDQLQAEVIKARDTQLKELTKVNDHLQVVKRSTKEDTSGGTCSVRKVFTFKKYKEFRCTDTSQFSDPFSVGSYKFKLCVSYFRQGISTFIFLMEEEYDDQLLWPLDVDVRLELLNQAGDDQCIGSTMTGKWKKGQGGEYRRICGHNVMNVSDVEKRGDGVQYVMSNSIKLRVHITII